ncbi:MAG: 3-dehydroquinate synthase [Thermoleophilia bacterium]|nr:3-dehydroquinate synthase [Thermoleophilia bacterium]
MVAPVGALGRHLALVGFMGAGKTAVGREVARLARRPFLDTDEEIVRRHGPIPRLFAEQGEAGFRALEEAVVAEALAADEPSVLALGGGAVTAGATRARLARRAFSVHLRVEPDEAWARVRGSDRPLARDASRFRALYEERLPLYRRVAASEAGDADGVLLGSLAVEVARGSAASVAARLPGAGRVALVVDERVHTRHPLALAGREVETHSVPPGEKAKRPAVAQRLWRGLTIGRDGAVVALGGGATTDLAGFVAATYARGVPWLAVPSTLVGQVDAAIGGKTGIDLPGGKNLVGAFHFPRSVVVDPDLLATLPERERRQGMAEVVKTGLLAGRATWELPQAELVRACAAFKCAVVLSDPFEEGRRAILNLGHTFAHALEAASEYRLRHGDAVALGLLAALRLSGQPTDVVEEVLRPAPVRVDRERAWAALGRDKKGVGGEARLVLLERPGEPQHGVAVPEHDVRAALDALIRD